MSYKTDKQKYKPSKGEVNLLQKGEKYLVRPNEAYSVRDAIIRHNNGTMNFDNKLTPFYEDQATFSTISLNQLQSMDLPEKLLFLDKVKVEASALAKKIAEHQTAIEQQQNPNDDTAEQEAEGTEAP